MTKIAACLIVRDSEATIEACLASVRPFVDAINIYDTGSTDGTLDLLERLNGADLWVCGLCGQQAHGESAEGEHFCIRGCIVDSDDDASQKHPATEVPLAPIRVEQGEWRDDFSWAREQSFAMASDDVTHLLWLDDDDVVAGAEHLRQLAAGMPAHVDGYVFQYEYATDELGNLVCVLWRERLMRRDRGYTWRGAVHEVLVPPEGHSPALEMIPPEHVRYVHNRPPSRYPPDRNLQILLRELETAEQEGRPADPRTLAYVGTEHMAGQRFHEALPYLHAYLDHPGTGWSDERMQVHHKLAMCLRLAGNPKAALHVEHEALKERHDWAETYVGLCESYVMVQNWGAVEWYAKQALQLGMPQSMLILNPLEFTFVPYIRLSEACLHTGRATEALAWLEKAAQVAPDHPLVTERRLAYERQRYENDLVSATLALREAAIRHDENLKALQIMENAPYVIADRPEIVKARADCREMCKHYLDPSEYLRWYTDEPKESSLTDDHIDLVAEAFGRVGGLIRGLEEQEQQLGRKPVVLDMGCNDWWMGEALARHGFRCDGVELNRRSYELAVERRDRFDREATIVHGDLHDAQRLLWEAIGQTGEPIPVKYDAVSLFEVIEHVPDPEHTLAVCEQLLAPGGRVYVSTPNGAFEQGNLPTWNIVQRKGHLRAIPIHELAEQLNARGDITHLEQTNGDRVAFAAYTPRRKRGKVVFYNGGSWEQWSPLQVINGGLGGSETALVRLSACLGRAGYEVKVYADTAERNSISAGGVVWKPFTAFDPTETCDLLVVSRLPHVFDNPSFAAARTALWCHDHSYPDGLTPARAEKIDHVVVLSEWQRRRFERLYPFAADRLHVQRNGITYIDPATQETVYGDAGRPFAERQPRCVFSSSADRGLDVLLQLWPRIRAKVPDAELHVFYGWETLDRVAIVNPQLLAYKARVFELVEECDGEAGGVFMRGRVGQRELAAEMMQARVWSYPTAFLETSCIGAMEARAAGLPIVTSGLGALRETVGPHGLLLGWGGEEDDPCNQTLEYQDAFVGKVVGLLTNEQRWTGWHRRALRGADRLDWLLRAEEWAHLIDGARAPRTRRKQPVAA